MQQARSSATVETRNASRDRDLAAALHVEHSDEVHVHADGDGGVAAREAA